MNASKRVATLVRPSALTKPNINRKLLKNSFSKISYEKQLAELNKYIQKGYIQAQTLVLEDGTFKLIDGRL